MRSENSTYKHFIPDIDLAIERNTSKVPADGKFYILKSGTIIQNFRSRKLAEEKFKQLLKESGFKPKELGNSKLDPINETVERYAKEKDLFWAEGPKHRRSGGRGRRGGI